MSSNRDLSNLNIVMIEMSNRDFRNSNLVLIKNRHVVATIYALRRYINIPGAQGTSITHGVDVV